MENYKKLEFVIIEHSLLKPFTLKEAIIWKTILFKAQNKHLNQFPYPKSYIKELTGIARNTINKALEKFEKLNLINIIDKKIYLTSNCESDFFFEIEREFLEQENKFRSNELTKIPTIHFNFKLCANLKINETQYSILHTYYILSRNNGYAFIGKNYFIRIFGVKERQFKAIKSKLLHNGYVSKKSSSESIYIPVNISEMFKKCTVKIND